MSTLISSSLIYLASAGFFHASAQRTWFEPLQSLPSRRQILWAVSSLSALLSFMVLWRTYGLETGLPVWLGMATLVGVVSLLIAALAKSWHFRSVALAGMVLLVAGLLRVFGGL